MNKKRDSIVQQVQFVRNINLKRQKNDEMGKVVNIDFINRKMMKCFQVIHTPITLPLKYHLEIQSHKSNHPILYHQKINFRGKSKDYLILIRQSNSYQEDNNYIISISNDKMQQMGVLGDLSHTEMLSLVKILQIQNWVYCICTHMMIQLNLCNKGYRKSKIFRQRIVSCQIYNEGLLLFVESNHNLMYFLIDTDMQIYYQSHLKTCIKSIEQSFRFYSIHKEIIYLGLKYKNNTSMLSKFQLNSISSITDQIGSNFELIHQAIPQHETNEANHLFIRTSTQILSICGNSIQKITSNLENLSSLKVCRLHGNIIYGLSNSGRKIIQCALNI